MLVENSYLRPSLRVFREQEVKDHRDAVQQLVGIQEEYPSPHLTSHLRSVNKGSGQCGEPHKTWMLHRSLIIVGYFSRQMIVQPFTCPVCVCIAGKLTLKIPWKNLYNEAVVVTLEGLYLLVVPGASKSLFKPPSREKHEQTGNI